MANKKLAQHLTSFNEEIGEDFEPYVNIIIKNQRCFKESGGEIGEEILLKDECEAVYRRIFYDPKG